ncbi:hypothetical protein JXB28_02555 [Candidatus Woesearchaeota archaeon]|nr:hypothetical protein [Candidatus Woesearchaeota archaeon]
MDEASDAFEVDREELSDLITELPFVSEGLAMGLLADRLSDRVPQGILANNLANENSEAASYLLYLTTNSKVEDGVTLMGALVYHMMKSTGPLPIVTRKAIKDIDREYRMNNDLCVFRRYGMVKKSNPHIYNLIEKFSFETDNIENTVKVLTLFYSAFERQAELNKRKFN